MKINECRNKNIFKLSLIFIISLFIILFFSTSTSPLYKDYYEDDSSIFIVIGRAMKNGLVLYKDIFDHKGPVFFLIQMLGQIICEGRIGIFILQVISLFITNIYIYKSARFFCNELKSIITILISMCLFTFFIEEGNLTEEFALPLLIYGIYLVLKWIIKEKMGNISWKYPILFGIIFGLLAFSRLNNAIVIVGLCLGIVIKIIKEKRYKELLKCFFGFCIGSAVVCVPVLIWSLKNNSLYEMIYGTFTHNLLYLKNFNNKFDLVDKLVYIGSLIILMIIVRNKVKNKYNDVYNILYLTSFLTIIMLLFQQAYSHYYLIIVPLFSIFISLLLSLFENEDKEYNFIKNIVIIVICIIYILPGVLNSIFYYTSMNKVNLNEIKDFVNLIPANEKDEIYMYRHHLSSIYIYGDFLPTYKYAFLQKNLMKSNSNIENEIFKYLKGNKNKWIISQDIEKFENKGIIENYILDNYEKYAEKEVIRLNRFSYRIEKINIYKYKE